MHRSLRPYVLAAVAAVVIGVLQNLFFGSDAPGTQHQVSVAFFFLAVEGVLALVALTVVALVRRRTGSVDAA